MEHDHQDSFIHIKDAFDKKIQISKQKREVKNDKLFNAENTCMQYTVDIDKSQKDSEKNIDRRMQQLNKQLRADLDHYKRTLMEHKEGKVLQIQNELNMQLKQKKAEFDQMRGENKIKDDESRHVLKQSVQKRLASDKEKETLESQDRLRETQLHSQLMLENMKKEVKQRIELEHQKKYNQLQLSEYKNARDQ